MGEMRLSLSALTERLETTLWFIPALFALSALAGATIVVAIDHELQQGSSPFFIYGGTPEGARSVLSTIAQSMLTFTGLVFTVTMLVLQLASSQLSPRVLRTFLSDRANQVVLGLFVATFLYTLVVLRDIRGGSGDPEAVFVPGLAVSLSFVLLVASVGAFVYYINHMAHAIRASTVIANIASETEQTLERRYPLSGRESSDGEAAAPGQVEMPARDASWGPIHADASGFLLSIDEDSLLKTAHALDLLIEIIPNVGDFVVRLAPVAFVNVDPTEEVADRVRSALSFGPERTMRRDPAFGFRQLVDVGIRALSPGTNDPSTAAHVVDRLHDLLRELSRRPMKPGIRVDGSGVARLRLSVWTWEAYVRLATDELLLYGRGHMQVLTALESMLASLARSVPEECRLAVFTALTDLKTIVDDKSSAMEAAP